MPDAVSVIQFYLPYLLPRAADWPAAALEMTTGDAVVRLRVPAATEDLFPSEVDRRLGALNINWTRDSPPARNILLPMRSRCLDRLEATVIAHVAGLADVAQEEVQLKFFNAAAQAANFFIDHCRVASRATFVTNIEATYLPHAGGSFARTPFTIRWTDNAGNPLAAYEGGANETGDTALFLDPERGSVPWLGIQMGIASGNPPNLSASLLIVAREQLMQIRVRESMLSAATACEAANTDYIARKGWQGHADVETALNAKRDSFAKKRFDAITMVIAKRSLAVDDPATYEALEDMYRGRNSIIHAGRLEYCRAGATVVIDLQEATRLLKGAEDATHWLESL